MTFASLASIPVVVGAVTGDPITLLIGGLTVFALACFVGFEVITKVPPTLHTPLMSGSNAISGITLAGAILAAGVEAPDWRKYSVSLQSSWRRSMSLVDSW